MTNSKIIVAVLLIVIGGGAFFAGMKYQESRRSTFNRQFAGAQGQRMGAAVNRGGFRPVAGEIIGSDDKSITVKLPDGSSKIVLLPDNTEINEATSAARSALTVGKAVSVFGQENSDGTVTAQTIQLNPTVRPGPNNP